MPILVCSSWLELRLNCTFWSNVQDWNNSKYIYVSLISISYLHSLRTSNRQNVWTAVLINLMVIYASHHRKSIWLLLVILRLVACVIKWTYRGFSRFYQILVVRCATSHCIPKVAWSKRRRMKYFRNKHIKKEIKDDPITEMKRKREQAKKELDQQIEEWQGGYDYWMKR